MAYSDYGGYAYLNGIRVEERSDYTITADGGFGTPGCYPGFARLAAGEAHADVMESLERDVYAHVVLGDGPIYVSLIKQSYVQFHRLTPAGVESIALQDATHAIPDDMFAEYEGKRYLRSRYEVGEDMDLAASLDGWLLEVRFTQEDNYYAYARLTQPDGAVWTGFSGYGVGAGLEDADYGFNTREREVRLCAIYPAQVDQSPSGSRPERA